MRSSELLDLEKMGVKLDLFLEYTLNYVKKIYFGLLTKCWQYCMSSTILHQLLHNYQYKNYFK
jgi:hypothetical protein